MWSEGTTDSKFFFMPQIRHHAVLSSVLFALEERGFNFKSYFTAPHCCSSRIFTSLTLQSPSLPPTPYHLILPSKWPVTLVQSALEFGSHWILVPATTVCYWVKSVLTTSLWLCLTPGTAPDLSPSKDPFRGPPFLQKGEMRLWQV